MNPPFDLSPSIYTVLPNGLTVLIRRDTSAPVVAIVTYVKAGYFDETDDVVGIAHVLEHMFFKGTERRGVGEIAKETKARGGYLNAHTIYDHTSYYTVLPSSSLQAGLDIQADAYSCSVIDANELAKELEVIIQEAKRKADNPGAVTIETLYELAHDRHRIRRWRIGREEGLRGLTRDAMLKFYRTYYRPGNTILSIAGDVDPDSTLALVEDLYGSLPGGEVPRNRGPSEPDRMGFRYRELAGDIAQTQLAMGWRTPPALHGDTPAMDFAAMILSAGRASRLYRAVRERKLAASVGSSNYTPTDLGVFTIHAEAKPDTAADAARAIWAQVEALREKGPSTLEIERVRRIFEARWLRRLETMEGQATHLAECEALGSWTLSASYYDAIMKLTAGQVRDTLQRYLDPDTASMLLYRPKSSPAVADDVEAMKRVLTAKAVDPLTSLPPRVARTVESDRSEVTRERVEHGVVMYRARNGLPILVRPRPGASITHLGLYSLGGSVEEREDSAGLTTLTARTMLKGTKTRSAEQIAEDSEMLGASLGASVGRESFGWGVSVPALNAALAFELLADVIQNATLSESAIETERAVALSELALLRDDMYRFPMRLANTTAFAGHPYGVPTLGTEESLRSLDANTIMEWYQAKVLSAPAVVIVVGNVDPDTIAAIVARELRTLNVRALTPMSPPQWPVQGGRALERRDKAQTALVMAFPGPSRLDEDRFAAGITATIASGLGGRFFDELRDKRSLAYTVHAFASEYRDAGMFVSYIATSPEKEDIARDGLLAEFAKLREAPVSEDELERAKTYTIGSHAIRQESGAAILADILDAWLFGRGLIELDEFEEKVRAVTAEQIQRLARTYFDPERRVEGIVRGEGKRV
jgi:zinc protease